MKQIKMAWKWACRRWQKCKSARFLFSLIIVIIQRPVGLAHGRVENPSGLDFGEGVQVVEMANEVGGSGDGMHGDELLLQGNEGEVYLNVALIRGGRVELLNLRGDVRNHMLERRQIKVLLPALETTAQIGKDFGQRRHKEPRRKKAARVDGVEHDSNRPLQGTRPSRGSGGVVGGKPSGGRREGGHCELQWVCWYAVSWPFVEQTWYALEIRGEGTLFGYP